MKHLSILFVALFLISCGQSSVKTGGTLKKREEIRVAMPTNGKAEHPTHGAEVWFAFGAIGNTTEQPVNGVAQAFGFEDGAYAASAQVNIDIPEDGQYYSAWLKNEETGDTVYTANLSNHFGDARHYLKYETDQDLRSYRTMLITRELDDGNPEMGEVLAQGLMKVVER